MQDISVIYFSKTTLRPGMGNFVHSHDYWHFSIRFRGTTVSPNNPSCVAPICSCTPPGVPHAGVICREESVNFNIMFFVHDESFKNALESFPFHHLKMDQLHLPLLEYLSNQIRTLCPSQGFINSTFSYFLHLLIESNQIPNVFPSNVTSLAERCVAFIEENYMHPIRVEDVANHIGRTKNHTSYLVRSITGATVIEHLNRTRIKNACAMLAYSSIPIEEVSTACGFADAKYFSRVFKSTVGTTPNRYRTSHAVNDMFYEGNIQDLAVPYDDCVYTYIPGARKCVYWKNPLEFIKQLPQN